MKSSTVIFGVPLKLLRLEGFAWFILTLFLFHYFEGSWWLFIALFFVPDIGLAGYFFNSKIGALVYNVFHSEIGPVILAGTGVILDSSFVINLSIIWLCHINFDRMLGIGLKFPTGFKETHLGAISFRK
jgi:hypothetical protein